MTRENFLKAFEAFCQGHKFENRGRVDLPNVALVYWKGDMCVKPFEEWIATQDVAAHTTPRLFSDGKGESFASYVTLS